MKTPVGTTLGNRYRLDAFIGGGRGGHVFRAFDTTLERDVAIKVLVEENSAIRGRFLNEAKSMALLNHPNIIAIYDFGEVNGSAYIVMEYVLGVTLNNIPPERSGFRERIGFFVTLCDALSYAHDQGIVHRDVKPANILIDDQGRLRVGDFGLSQRLSDASTFARAGEIAGTIAYLPPESFLGQPTDARGDLYSLGVVMYEHFTGKAPFASASDDIVAVIYAHVNDHPIPPRVLAPHMPPALETLIMKLLEKDPGKRYDTAAALCRDLLAIGQLDARLTHDAPEILVKPAPQRREVDPALRALLDRISAKPRTPNAVQAELLAAMLAERGKRYDEAAEHYGLALGAFGTTQASIDFARAALRYGEMTANRCAEINSLIAKAELARVVSALKLASPTFRTDGTAREHELCETLIGLLTAFTDRAK